MEHKRFRILSILALFLIIFTVGVFDYLTIIDEKYIFRGILKIWPNFILLVLIVSYFIIYKTTFYSVLIFASILSCMIGDIFLFLYNPSPSPSLNSSIDFYLIGGILFFLARVILLITFSCKIYSQKITIISYRNRKLFLSHIFFNIPFLTIGIVNLVYNYNFNSILILLYIFFGFGFQLSYAFLRIGKFSHNNQITIFDNYLDTYGEPIESKFSCIYAFIGYFLFNISDLLLLLTMFNKFFPAYLILVSDNIYWLSMYLLTISIVRTSYTHLE